MVHLTKTKHAYSTVTDVQAADKECQSARALCGRVLIDGVNAEQRLRSKKTNPLRTLHGRKSALETSRSRSLGGSSAAPPPLGSGLRARMV